MAENIVFVYVTCADQAEAEGIARLLVEEEIAACGNVLPGVKSFYRWENEVKTAEEAVLILKTKKSLFKKLQHRVEQLHSYQNPCIVAIDIDEGSEVYIKWIETSTA